LDLNLVNLPIDGKSSIPIIPYIKLKYSLKTKYNCISTFIIKYYILVNLLLVSLNRERGTINRRVSKEPIIR